MTMKFVTPADYTLVSTNVPNDYSDWVAGSYDETDDPVVYGDSVYRAATSTTDRPDLGALKSPPTWVRMGYSNQQRMFNSGVDSVSSATGDITVQLTTPDLVDNFTVLGLMGSTVQLTVTDATEGVVYDETQTLTDAGASDWYEWYFFDYDIITVAVFDGIPPYPNTTYDLVISGTQPTDPVECGRVIFGPEFLIGGMTYGTSFTALSTSKVNRDEFGNSQYIKRRTIARNDYDIVIDARRISDIRRALRKVDAVPTLFIGTELEEASIIFGFSREFSMNARSPKVGYVSLQVEEI